MIVVVFETEVCMRIKLDGNPWRNGSRRSIGSKPQVSSAHAKRRGSPRITLNYEGHAIRTLRAAAVDAADSEGKAGAERRIRPEQNGLFQDRAPRLAHHVVREAKDGTGRVSTPVQRELRNVRTIVDMLIHRGVRAAATDRHGFGAGPRRNRRPDGCYGPDGTEAVGRDVVAPTICHIDEPAGGVCRNSNGP